MLVFQGANSKMKIFWLSWLRLVFWAWFINKRVELYWILHKNGIFFLEDMGMSCGFLMCFQLWPSDKHQLLGFA